MNNINTENNEVNSSPSKYDINDDIIMSLNDLCAYIKELIKINNIYIGSAKNSSETVRNNIIF